MLTYLLYTLYHKEIKDCVIVDTLANWVLLHSTRPTHFADSPSSAWDRRQDCLPVTNSRLSASDWRFNSTSCAQPSSWWHQARLWGSLGLLSRRYIFFSSFSSPASSLSASFLAFYPSPTSSSCDSLLDVVLPSSSDPPQDVISSLVYRQRLKEIVLAHIQHWLSSQGRSGSHGLSRISSWQWRVVVTTLTANK